MLSQAKPQAKPFAMDDMVIKAFKESREKGEALVKNVTESGAPVSTKLKVMARILTEPPADEKLATTMLRVLPTDFMTLNQQLRAVDLPYQTVDTLIQFLLKRKILSHKKNYSLYYNIAEGFEQRQDYQGMIHFYKLALAQTNITPENRHALHYLLGITHCFLGEEKEKQHHFSQALALETPAKLRAAFIEQEGVVPRLLRDFTESVTQSQPLHFYLENAIDIAPDHTAVLKVINDYVQKILERPQSTIKATEIIMALNLILRSPKVTHRFADLISKLLDCILKSPVAECPLHLKGTCFKQVKQYDKAIELAQTELASQPDSVGALFLLGECLFDSDELEKATAPFLRLEALQNVTLKTRQITLSYLAGIYVALQAPEQALHYAELGISLDPHNVSNYANRILATLHLDRVKLAKKLLTEANALFPRNPALEQCRQRLYPLTTYLSFNPDADNRTLLLEIAIHSQSRKEFELAKQKQTLLNQRGISASFYMAAIHFAEGDYPQALKFYLATLNSVNRLSIAPYLMKSYSQLKQYPGAIEQASYILAHNHWTTPQGFKTRRAAYSCLVHCYSATQSFKEGAEKLTQALDLKGITDAEKELLYCYIAQLHYSQEEFSAAEEFIHRALNSSDPRLQTGAYRLLGFISNRNGKPAQAIELLLKYLKRQPNDLEALGELAKAFFTAEETRTQGMEYFAKALEQDPSIITALMDNIPAGALEQLQNPVKISVSPPEAAPQPVSGKEEAKDERMATKAFSTSVMMSALSLEPKSIKPADCRAKRDHLRHQAAKEKERIRQQALQTQFFADESEDMEEKEDKVPEGWQVPGLGFVSINDPRIAKINYAHHSREKSHLFAILNTEKLKPEVESMPELISKWQGLIEKGTIVGEKNQQGIRMLRTQERAKLAEILNEDVVAKLKLLGQGGDARAYGRMFTPLNVNSRDRLLVFDIARLKTHTR